MIALAAGSAPYIRLATSHFNRSSGISPRSARICRTSRSRVHFSMAAHRAMRSCGESASIRELYCCEMRVLEEMAADWPGKRICAAETPDGYGTSNSYWYDSRKGTSFPSWSATICRNWVCRLSGGNSAPLTSKWTVKRPCSERRRISRSW